MGLECVAGAGCGSYGSPAWGARGLWSVLLADLAFIIRQVVFRTLNVSLVESPNSMQRSLKVYLAMANPRLLITNRFLQDNASRAGLLKVQTCL